MEITLNEMISHWQRGETKMGMGNRLHYNIGNFITEAGDYSRRFFQFSFASGGFYASGQSWKPRTSPWGKKFTHPVLIDTGKLKESIKGERIFDGKKGSHDTYRIKTTALSEAVARKRGESTKDSSYAAVHNTDARISPFSVNQYCKRTPVQRQFIGLSDKLDNYINTHYVPRIFKYFPL